MRIDYGSTDGRDTSSRFVTMVVFGKWVENQRLGGDNLEQ